MIRTQDYHVAPSAESDRNVRDNAQPPTPDYKAKFPPTPRCWLEYERRKNALPIGLSCAEYDHHVAVIVADLGI